MSHNNSNSSLRDWIATIAVALGFLTTLATFVNDFLQWIQDSQKSRYLSVAGFVLCVIGILWIVLKAENVRPKWRWASLVVLYIITAAYFLWAGTWIEMPPTSDWPPDLITYYDFETEAELEGWRGETRRSTEHAFAGRYALEATQPIQTDQETGLNLRWEHEIAADVIVGQVYWPDDEDVQVIWAQVCVPLSEWNCVSIPRNRGGWNTFVLDLSEMTVGDTRLNELVLPGLYFQGRLRGSGGTSVSTVPMYVDAILIYRDGRD
jgi:hypothetical protein